MASVLVITWAVAAAFWAGFRVGQTIGLRRIAEEPDTWTEGGETMIERVHAHTLGMVPPLDERR